MSVIQKVRRRFAQALVTGGQRSPGFFVPYDYVSSVDQERPTYDDMAAYLAEDDQAFRDLVAEFAQTWDSLSTHVDEKRVPWEPMGMFPVLDVLALYHMVRKHQPQKVLEIGSGASSHVITAALQDNAAGELTCIDPVPRRSIAQTGAKILPRVLQIEDAELVTSMTANDILFIDSSHIMLEGMDVDIQFNRMFPKLRPGTLVHVHDIFLPDAYPRHWRVRQYSEQNALMGWILSGYFEVLYPGYYVATRMQSALAQVLGDKMPARPEREAGSIWLRRPLNGG